MAGPAVTLKKAIAPFFESECLDVALKKRDVAMMRRALDTDGSQKETVFATGFTPVIACTATEFTDGLELLLSRGADANARVQNINNVKYQSTALHIAVKNKSYHCIDILMRYGADVHASDKNGLSPIDLARGDDKALNLLLRTL
jgi:hypothetical protein